MSTIKLGPGTPYPMAVFVCNEITIDDEGKVVSVVPNPDMEYKVVIMKKDDKTYMTITSDPK